MENKIKPNLFIVGAAKAGTSALHAILSEHPNIFMSPVKEPNYFSSDLLVDNFNSEQKKKFKNEKIQFLNNGAVRPCHQLYVRNKTDYLRLFKDADSKVKYCGEASVSYLFSKIAAQKIKEFNPVSKIIIILRNPVERAFSHFLMDLKIGRSKSTNFISAVESDLKSNTEYWENDHLYVELGLYYEQVKRYKEIFPKENILIINFEQFKNDYNNTMQKIQDFLGLPLFINEKSSKQINIAKIPKNYFAGKLIRSHHLKHVGRIILNSSVRKKIKDRLLTDKKIPVLSNNERKYLLQFFRNDIDRLENLLEQDLTSWKTIN